VSARVHGVKAMLDLHLEWVVLHVNVWNMFNLVSGTTFFKNCNFVLTPWINSSHLFINFMHTHFHYIFQKLLDIGISQSFHLNLVHDKGILWEECCPHWFIFTLFVLMQQPTLFVLFLSSANGTHIVGFASNMLFFFYDYRKSLEH